VPLRVWGVIAGEWEPAVEACSQFGSEWRRGIGSDLSAVGAEIAELAAGGPFDAPTRLVDEPVVEAALGPEVPRNGGPASRAVDDVVDLQEVVLARSLGSCSRRRAAGSCA